MSPRSGFHGPRPGRVLGLYALATMDREGPIYGYLLSERVAERTDGAWRPGAGAIYPALARLADRGFARRMPAKGRRMYAITPRGRVFLARIRSDWMGSRGSGPDLSRLWAEISGAGDAGEHMIRHLRRHLDAATAFVERDPRARAGAAFFAAEVLAELRVAERRISSLAPGTPGRRAPRRRRAE